MPSDDSPVGYKRPPAHSRFQKGQSGNPRGRPKKVPDFMEDAAEILGGTVTGQAKGKPIALPMVQAMFRTLCRRALKGGNRALRRVIELMLTLEPVARNKAKEARKEDAAIREAERKFDRVAGVDPDKIDEARKEPDPEMDEMDRRLEALVRNERRRLLREARRSRSLGANAPIKTGLQRLDYGAHRSIAMGVRRGEPSPSLSPRPAPSGHPGKRVINRDTWHFLAPLTRP